MMHAVKPPRENQLIANYVYLDPWLGRLNITTYKNPDPVEN
jgi:hypothetical protein